MKIKKMHPILKLGIIITISLIITLRGALPFIEGQFHKCEKFLNPGGPNYPYCKTIWFGVLSWPGLIAAIMLQDIIPGEIFIALIFVLNFVLYFGIIKIIDNIIRRKKTTSSKLN